MQAWYWRKHSPECGSVVALVLCSMLLSAYLDLTSEGVLEESKVVLGWTGMIRIKEIIRSVYHLQGSI